MTRARTLKDVAVAMGWVCSCVLLGTIAGRIAHYFGAPMEIRLLAFAVVTGLALLVWYFGPTSEVRRAD